MHSKSLLVAACNVLGGAVLLAILSALCIRQLFHSLTHAASALHR